MDWLYQSTSYLGIVLFMVLTGCGLPLPEEVAIVYAGVQSAQGDLLAPLAFAACLIGALAGDAVMYAIGYHFGHGLLRKRPFFAKLVHAEREEYFERAVLRHGFKVLLLARFMVGVRGPVYLAAGVVRMPFRRFLLWDSFCATAVVGSFFALTYYFGPHIAHLLKDTEAVLTIVVLAVVGIVAFIALRRYRKRVMDRVLETGDAVGPQNNGEIHERSERTREAL